MILNEEFFMNEALKEAQQAFDEGEVPIGAVIVKDNTIIARAHNQSRRLRDPTAHAEMLAITQACQVLGDRELETCALYVTVEPCIMCIGAVLHARIKVLYYGTPEPIFGALGSRLDLMREFGNCLKKVKSGILKERAHTLLQDFFRRQRKIKKMERWLSG